MTSKTAPLDPDLHVAPGARGRAEVHARRRRRDGRELVALENPREDDRRVVEDLTGRRSPAATYAMTLPNGRKTVKIELTGSRDADIELANKAAKLDEPQRATPGTTSRTRAQ